MQVFSVCDMMVPSTCVCFSNFRKTDLINDLREYQRQLKDTKQQLEKIESAELEARATAHDTRHSLELAEASLKEQTASSKTVIGSLQLEIKNLKTR